MFSSQSTFVFCNFELFFVFLFEARTQIKMTNQSAHFVAHAGDFECLRKFHRCDSYSDVIIFTISIRFLHFCDHLWFHSKDVSKFCCYRISIVENILRNVLTFMISVCSIHQVEWVGPNVADAIFFYKICWQFFTAEQPEINPWFLKQNCVHTLLKYSPYFPLSQYFDIGFHADGT